MTQSMNFSVHPTGQTVVQYTLPEQISSNVDLAGVTILMAVGSWDGQTMLVDWRTPEDITGEGTSRTVRLLLTDADIPADARTGRKYWLWAWIADSPERFPFLLGPIRFQ